MNKFIATVEEIVSLERLNLIKFRLNEETINMLVLELNMDLKIGNKAELVIKPTAISVVNNKCCFENSLKGRVKSITNGKILSSISIETEGFEIEAITLKNNCALGEDVYILFKANDVAVSKVIDEV